MEFLLVVFVGWAISKVLSGGKEESKQEQSRGNNPYDLTTSREADPGFHRYMRDDAENRYK